jgi:hypothetical protein
MENLKNKYSNWTVLKRLKGSIALCRCVCGKEKLVRIQTLREKTSKSCGCKRISNTKGNPNFGTYNRTYITTGISKHRLYTIWHGMKNRCYVKSHSSYKYYGLKGIKICKRWLNYQNFFDDMLQSHNEHFKEFGKKDTTLDRINGNGNYYLENCRWATKKEQGLNSKLAIYKRKKRKLTCG